MDESGKGSLSGGIKVGSSTLGPMKGEPHPRSPLLSEEVNPQVVAAGHVGTVAEGLEIEPKPEGRKGFENLGEMEPDI